MSEETYGMTTIHLSSKDVKRLLKGKSVSKESKDGYGNTVEPVKVVYVEESK